MILLHRLRVQNFKQLTDVCLNFPDKGTILIEGHNEAGKSSLFEAVYYALYGEPLLGTLEQVRSYGSDELFVELEFSISGRRFLVSRRLKSQHRTTLTIYADDGTTEVINTLTPANKRILVELNINPTSLLNTCFVEQKRLEKLEELDPNGRQKAINELLNLRVLSCMKEEYKVSREEQSDLSRLKGRVEVARLDVVIPEIVATVRRAHLCLLFRQVETLETQLSAWEVEIASAQTRLAETTARRVEIKNLLAECDRLRLILGRLTTDLPRRIDAWEGAGIALREATAEQDRLQRIADALPARQAQLKFWNGLADLLVTLETKESDIATIEDESTAKRQEIEDYKTLLATWEKADAEGLLIVARIEQEQTTLKEAEERIASRTKVRERIDQLNLVAQKIQSCERAITEHEEAAQRLTEAKQKADSLPALLARLEKLEDLAGQWRQRERNLADQERLREKIRELRAKEEEIAAYRRQQTKLVAEIEAKKREITAVQEQERQVSGLLYRAEQQRALETWAETAERCAEFGVGSATDAGLASRIQQADERVQTATEKVQQSGKKGLPGYISIGAGLVAGGVLSALGQLVFALLLAVVLVLVGSLLVFNGHQAVRKVQEELQHLNIERATLEGERKTVEARVQANAQQLLVWQQREATARQEMTRLGLDADTPIAARELARELMVTDIANVQKSQNALYTSLQKLQTELGVIVASQQATEQQINKIDESAMATAIQVAEADLDNLTASLPSPEILVQASRELDVPSDPVLLQGTIRDLNGSIAIARASQSALATFTSDEQNKARIVKTEQDAIAKYSRELGIPGGDVPGWKEACRVENESLMGELKNLPFDALQTAVRVAKETLAESNRQLTMLETQQKGRREVLDGKSLDDFEQELIGLEANLSRLIGECEPLAEIRTTLQREDLPTESGELKINLATKKAEIERDVTDANKITVIERRAAECRIALEKRHMDLLSGWKEILSVPMPDTYESAHDLLQAQKTAIQERLLSYGEEALRNEETGLDAVERNLGQTIATKKHQQEAGNKQREELMTSMLSEASLEMEMRDEEIRSSVLRDRIQELASVDDHDEEGWEHAWQDACELERSTRSDRRAKAQVYAVTEDALDFEASRTEMEQKEREIAVKKRAGEIVDRTRQSIVSRVMPLTLQNVGQLLPLLTDGRYSDVQWDDKTNTLEVYDTRARSYQRKRIFSGGARDQISLALRLGFALATLPGEHNARPGWLFLDEPLSSFDRTRTQALVDLLTKGLIRKQFAQIFLVSHSESFDPRLFDHRLRLESGTVLESSLP